MKTLKRVEKIMQVNEETDLQMAFDMDFGSGSAIFNGEYWRVGTMEGVVRVSALYSGIGTRDTIYNNEHEIGFEVK